MDEDLRRKIDEAYERHQKEKSYAPRGGHQRRNADLVRGLEQLAPFVPREAPGEWPAQKQARWDGWEV